MDRTAFMKALAGTRDTLAWHVCNYGMIRGYPDAQSRAAGRGGLCPIRAVWLALHPRRTSGETWHDAARRLELPDDDTHEIKQAADNVPPWTGISGIEAMRRTRKDLLAALGCTHDPTTATR